MSITRVENSERTKKEELTSGNSFVNLNILLCVSMHACMREIRQGKGGKGQ